MDLREIGATLPPGFRFCPSDEELVCHYLFNKITNEELIKGTLVEIDLHICEPWQLPEVTKLNSSEWYFFSFRDRKYTTGFRANRATISGYWKATGKDRIVLDPCTRATVGMRKTLVFYKNRAPNGIKTGWIMHEFRLENPHIPPKEDWVLCRVFHKAKGENDNNCTNNLSPQNTYETAVTSPELYNHSLNYDINNQNPPHQSQNSNIIHHHLFDLLVKNHLQLSHQEMNEVSKDETTIHLSKYGQEDDQYGLMFDMDFEVPYLQGEGLHSSLEDMKFDDENSMVFI
ncbi:PREDICTED: NAC domain-containing protein 21/22-like [Nicotiana attenuata]|uniref:Protein cup-shaped cotyledon 3 n=1 Tax=Nicotiana attenuata TaxID=49451 RepID=A0A1J6J423_NICAT|nr:PREDICTED: NAC domain-containing protein 21/22-like [Nicotiana attenuata]OIT02033.1 protein cup-shaped cotyledon 3 [Nicotiana attenuata]